MDYIHIDYNGLQPGNEPPFETESFKGYSSSTAALFSVSKRGQLKSWRIKSNSVGCKWYNFNYSGVVEGKTRFRKFKAIFNNGKLVPDTLEIN